MTSGDHTARGGCPYTLRRTFATLALTARGNPRLVMAQIGHADPRLTVAPLW